MLEEGDSIRDYTLNRFLGRGAFSEVWLAERRVELAEEGIPVALKFLAYESDKEDFSGRVKNEVKTWIKAGSHFNIVPVYDGFKYSRFLVIASEYVDGGSLRDWLVSNNGKAPSLKEAIAMMRGILLGLIHLHSRRIIHRDLKPENILLKNGIPKIADFGLARVLETISQSTTLRFTKGAGTPAYMPPEAFNEGSPTPQVDIWSAGVIFYEMLSGNTPFRASNFSALYSEIKNKEPEPLPSEVSKKIQEVVSLSLAKNVSVRFQTPESMYDALEKAWAELQGNMKWRSETVTEEVQLEEERQLREIGEERQQEGRQNNRDSGARRQSEVPTANLVGNIKTMQRETALIGNPEQEIPGQKKPEEGRRIINSKKVWIVIVIIVLVIVIGIMKINRPRTVNPPNQTAIPDLPAETYLNRGRACGDKEDYDCAVENFTKAIELNPQYALAFSYRGLTYAYQGDHDKAFADYNRAIELNPQDPFTFFNRGYLNKLQGNFDPAIKDFDTAIKLNPRYTLAIFNRGQVYHDKGEYEKAIDDYKKVIDMEPQDALAYFYRGHVYYVTGRYKPALKDFNKGLKLDPQNVEGLYSRGVVYAIQGNYDPAINDFTEVIKLDPNHVKALYDRAQVYERLGQTEKATADRQKYNELSGKKD